jgi:hypothetical protein
MTEPRPLRHKRTPGSRNPQGHSENSRLRSVMRRVRPVVKPGRERRETPVLASVSRLRKRLLRASTRWSCAHAERPGPVLQATFSRPLPRSIGPNRAQVNPPGAVRRRGAAQAREEEERAASVGCGVSPASERRRRRRQRRRPRRRASARGGPTLASIAPRSAECSPRWDKLHRHHEAWQEVHGMVSRPPSPRPFLTDERANLNASLSGNGRALGAGTWEVSRGWNGSSAADAMYRKGVMRSQAHELAARNGQVGPARSRPVSRTLASVSARPVPRPVSDEAWQRTLRDGGVTRPRPPRPPTTWAWCPTCQLTVPGRVRWWPSSSAGGPGQAGQQKCQKENGWSSEHAAGGMSFSTRTPARQLSSSVVDHVVDGTRYRAVISCSRMDGGPHAL